MHRSSGSEFHAAGPACVNTRSLNSGSVILKTVECVKMFKFCQIFRCSLSFVVAVHVSYTR